MRRMTPLISNARVISVDVPSRRLWVTLPSTQIVQVRTTFPGAADGLRVNHKALPGRGTEGLVLFPGGDNRNGFWIASIYAQAMDALTTQNDPYLEYDSHWSGHYRILDKNGNLTESHADGSFLQVGSGTAPPPTSRHTVDAKQVRQVTPLAQAQRVPNPPPPFNFTLRHITGTVALIDTAGNVVVSGAPAASSTHTFGGTTLHIDPSGNVNLAGASGASLTVTFGGATVNIDSSGNVSITAPTSVKIGGPGETLHPLLTSLAAAVYNSHNHGSNGAAAPTQQMTGGDQTTILTAG